MTAHRARIELTAWEVDVLLGALKRIYRPAPAHPNERLTALVVKLERAERMTDR